MKRSINDEHVINGTFGEIYIDGEYIASVESFSAKVSMNYADVNRPRDLWTGKKLISLEGSGELSIEKYTSLGIRLMQEKLKQNKTPVAKILATLDDPDALGAEKIMLNNVTFTELTLMDFQHADVVKENLSFNFRSYELYDFID